MVEWLIGVGLVVGFGLVCFGAAEVCQILAGCSVRRRPDYVRDPASITEADARLRNELARHVDGIDR